MKHRLSRVLGVPTAGLFVAYLIALSGSLTDDSPPSDLYDCASSLREARRIAVRDAASIGYEGPFVWSCPNGVHELDATWVRDEERQP